MDDPTVVVRNPLTVIGVQTRTTNAEEMNPATARIPGVWQAYFQAKDRIANSTGAIVGVYTDYESDHRGAYTLLVGSEVPAESKAPAGLSVLHLPGGAYARFVARGEMPGALIATWQRIWEHFDEAAPQTRTYLVDYELHDPGGQHVEVFVGVSA